MIMPHEYEKYWWYGPLMLFVLGSALAILLLLFSGKAEPFELQQYKEAHDHPVFKVLCQCGSGFCYVGGPYDGERNEKRK